MRRIASIHDGSRLGGLQTLVALACFLAAFGPTRAEPIRVNFQDAATSVPAGYVKDFGEPFGPRTGPDQGLGLSYGWVVSGTQTSLDLVGEGQVRSLAADPRLDTLVEMDRPSSPQGPGSWEIVIAAGTYQVTVAVGDPAHTDSRHWLAIEGRAAVRDFVPDATYLHATATVVVDVADGRLTIDAVGGQNTKLHYVDIDEVSRINVNLQTVDAPVPTGYLKDFGESFGARTGADQGSGLSYGWVVPGSSTPVDMTGEGRDREVQADQRLDTLVHMNRAASSVAGSWELDLANGAYEVTVAAGDPSHTDSVHTILVEGNPAIDGFVPVAPNLHGFGTVVATVGDGRLTVDGSTGDNAKLHFVEVVPSAGDNPRSSGVVPVEGATGVDLDGFVSATVSLPVASLATATVNDQTVLLYPQGNRTAPVSAIVNTTGGGDAIVLDPIGALSPATAYTFEITSGVRDLAGNVFLPFIASFTTGEEATGQLPSVRFERVTVANGIQYTSVAFGPDARLYALAVDGMIHRFSVDADGTLIGQESLDALQLAEGGARLAIGMVHDPNSSPANPIVWITHTTYGFSGMADWGGKISRLSGPDLETVETIVTGLPRSARDHVTNGAAFGPDGALYFLQGSNSAMGSPDTAWGNRAERALSAAVLRLDPGAVLNPPLDVTTEDGGSYDPQAVGAALTVHAGGVRNAYDLAWHSNGQLYVPTNGSASGGNTPATPVPLPDVCDSRIDGSYSGPDVPAINGVNQTQNDFLFRVVAGGYYGHPNPTRCEWVLNGGNPTAGVDAAEVGQYPVGTDTDRNYRGFAYDFEKNKSPNGVIEYRGTAFSGGLQGALLVARYSGGDDLIVLYPDGQSGDIAVAFDEVEDFEGFNNPLDLIEDPATGNLYVSEYGASRLTLLRVVDDAAADVTVDPEELIFSAVVATTSEPSGATLTNVGSPIDLTAASIVGQDAGQFVLSGSPTLPSTLPQDGSAVFEVEFTPSSTGTKAAALEIVTDRGIVSIGLYGLGMQGLEGGNEPPLQAVVDTLGYAIDVGGTQLQLGTSAAMIGDEVPVPLFVRAAPGPVTVMPVARYSPAFVLPFGAYLPDGSTPVHLEVGQLDPSASPPEHQTLFPNVVAGGTTLDPGSAVFGLYTTSPSHSAYSEDALNAALFPSNVEHAVRVYPLRDRVGAPILHAYLVGFEEASNGDYQDYVFAVGNVSPVILDTRPTLSLNRSPSGTRVDWHPVEGATGYDLVTGDLEVLLGAGGDFAAAAPTCIGDDLQRFHAFAAGDPPSGAATWFLMRCEGCSATGYDSAGAGQVSSRDGLLAVCP